MTTPEKNTKKKTSVAKAGKVAPGAPVGKKTGTRKETKSVATVALELLNLNVVPVTNYTDDQVAEILRRGILNLMERADLDSVRICATSQHEGKTHYYSTGVGNIYAQMGSVNEWLAGTGGDMDGPAGGFPGEAMGPNDGNWQD